MTSPKISGTDRSVSRVIYYRQKDSNGGFYIFKCILKPLTQGAYSKGF